MANILCAIMMLYSLEMKIEIEMIKEIPEESFTQRKTHGLRSTVDLEESARV